MITSKTKKKKLKFKNFSLIKKVSKKTNHTYLKIFKKKIEFFVPDNTIEFIITHYNESFKYLDYLPNNQKITIYHKGDKNLIKDNIFKKNVTIIKLDNIGRDSHTNIYHISKNYKNLSMINFFITGSFLSYEDRVKSLVEVFAKITSPFKKKYKGFYGSFDDKKNFFKKNKIKLDPKFRILQHKGERLIPSKIFPFDSWFKFYFPEKKLIKKLESLNGILAVDKKNILSIQKKIYDKIVEEFKIVNESYESVHYIERAYTSMFKIQS